MTDDIDKLDDIEREFIDNLRKAGEGMTSEAYDDFLNSYANFTLEYYFDKKFRIICNQQLKQGRNPFHVWLEKH